MPAITVIPDSVAIRRTPSAQGPSTGSAIGPSGTPNRHMVASGNTTSFAPASAARPAYSRTSCRFCAGSVPLRICANAIRMGASLGASAVGGLGVVCNPLRGEPLFCYHQVGQSGADEILQLAPDEWDTHVDGDPALQPRAARLRRGRQLGTARHIRRSIHDRSRDGRHRNAAGDRAPGLLALDAQIAPVYLRDQSRQPVTVDHLQRGHVDGAVVSGFTTDSQRLQLRVVDTGRREPVQPVVLLAVRLKNRFDVAFAVGGYVE